MLSEKQIENFKNKATPAQTEMALCEAFRILGDWNRYRIIKTLLKAKELCVGDIAKIVDLTMPATSQHLRILELSGLVISARLGQTICYKPLLKNPQIKAIIKLIAQI